MINPHKKGSISTKVMEMIQNIKEYGSNELLNIE